MIFSNLAQCLLKKNSNNIDYNLWGIEINSATSQNHTFSDLTACTVQIWSTFGCDFAGSCCADLKYIGLIWFFKFYFYADCSVIDVHYSNNGFYCRMKREENVTRKWCIEIYFLLDREMKSINIKNFQKKKNQEWI